MQNNEKQLSLRSLALITGIIAVAMTATTKDCSVDVDATIDGTSWINQVSSHTITAGTTYNYTLTNIGYRQVKISTNQNALGTTEIYYVLK